jgi:hypothetical protein
MGNRLSKEAFIAYFNRMPDNISVNWLRDGDFIIGKVKSEDIEFMTQAKDANEFVEMVNDALITVYNIPRGYLEVVKQARAYSPTQAEWNDLNNVAIKKCSLGFKKDKKILTLA